MRTSKYSPGLISALVLLVALAAGPALAGGPLLVYDAATQTPWAYPPGNVDVYTDIGGMGPFLTGPEADALTAAGYGQWSSVATAYFSASVTGDFTLVGLPDIVGANAFLVVGTFTSGGIHVMYDADGSIISDFFGAPPGVLGIASPDFGDPVTGELTESWAVLNGQAVDPADVGGASFGGVFTHEFGHSINLAHTQTNGAVGFFGDEDHPTGCPAAPWSGGLTFDEFETMYPFIDPSANSVGIQMATVNVLDDIQALSDVYPAAGWPGAYPSISGTITLPDGVTEITGVNVIARNLANPFEDATSMLSGAFTQGDLGPDGRYHFTGLTPGATYVVYVDEIVAGGFSTTPVSPLPGPEEYWNLAESGDISTDDACVYDGIVASGASTADIILNGNPNAIPIGDDDFVELALPFAFPICDQSYNSVFVGSNGFLTFGSGDTDFSESVADFLSGPPRIAGLWDDLDPSSGGFITAEQVGADFVITYDGVPEFFSSFGNTFSITLRPDGTHRVVYGDIAATDGLAGRTVGNGAADPGEIDLTASAQPIGQGLDSAYEIFSSSDNDLSGADLDHAACPLPAMISVDPTSLTATVCPDGTASQTLTLSNDGEQDLVFGILSGLLTSSVVQGRILDLPEVTRTPVRILGSDLGDRVEAKLQREMALNAASGRKAPVARSSFSNIPLPHLYALSLLIEDFNGGFPAGWSVVDNEGNGVNWEVPQQLTGNHTGGSGDAAGANSDGVGPAEFDTELWSPPVSGFGPNVILSYTANYQNFAGLDFLDLDISTDGGATWTTVLSWNEDHGGFFGPPGEQVVLNLDAYLTGASEFIVRWHYYDPNAGDYDWYAQIDDVTIVSDQPLTPCPWLTVSPTNGVVPPGESVTITVDYDAAGLALGTYPCDIFINSNAVNASSVDIPVSLTVEDNAADITLADHAVLWPPNHDYVTFSVTDIIASIDDLCDGSIDPATAQIDMVSSDEPENGKGDGNTTHDIVIAPDCKSVDLRSERQGSGDGRVYTILVSVVDGGGNSSSVAYQVSVPHDQGGSPAVDSGAVYLVGSACAELPGGTPVIGMAAETVAPITAQQFALRQNSPNPFGASTVISFQLPEESPVRLQVYDSAGRLVRTLLNESRGAGQHQLTWDGTTNSGVDAPSGIFFYKLEAGAYTEIRKMILTKR